MVNHKLDSLQQEESRLGNCFIRICISINGNRTSWIRIKHGLVIVLLEYALRLIAVLANGLVLSEFGNMN